MHLQDGTLLQGGKYRIVRFIGSGGFGCTYEACHEMLEKRVAIKEFFVKDFCNRDEATCHVTVGTQSKKSLVAKLRKKFIDEAKALCRLQHPGIVRVTDVFEENGTAYFVMDYVDGRSLSDMVNSRPLSEPVALDYIRQVCVALQYVHSSNRLHLDIKPANIMVDRQGKAVLIDFGASKQYDEENDENTSTLMGKTPGYAPPEQMGNAVSHFIPATDIYALGATLYKVLTGVTPPASNLIISGEVLPPMPQSISAATRDAVAAAMQLNKNKRPQSVADFLALLGGEDREVTEIVIERKIDDDSSSQIHFHNFDESSPSKASSSSSVPFIRRYGAWLVGVAVVAVVALAAFVWSRGGSANGTLDSEMENGENVVPAKSSPSVPRPRIVSTGSIAGHDYVDLGLSVKWATYNVGAEKPSDYGDYFAWGETSPKSEYTEENSVTYKKNMGDIAGDSRYDAARANWGGSWRLPTRAEMEELVNKCKTRWTTYNGSKGRLVTGPNGKSLFLPAAGWRGDSSQYDVRKYGFYWSSTPSEINTPYACLLGFYDGNFYRHWLSRYCGFPVRPVSE